MRFVNPSGEVVELRRYNALHDPGVFHGNGRFYDPTDPEKTPLVPIPSAGANGGRKEPVREAPPVRAPAAKKKHTPPPPTDDDEDDEDDLDDDDTDSVDTDDDEEDEDERSARRVPTHKALGVTRRGWQEARNAVAPGLALVPHIPSAKAVMSKRGKVESFTFPEASTYEPAKPTKSEEPGYRVDSPTITARRKGARAR